MVLSDPGQVSLAEKTQRQRAVQRGFDILLRSPSEHSQTPLGRQPVLLRPDHARGAIPVGVGQRPAETRSPQAPRQIRNKIGVEIKAPYVEAQNNPETLSDCGLRVFQYLFEKIRAAVIPGFIDVEQQSAILG